MATVYVDYAASRFSGQIWIAYDKKTDASALNKSIK